ncbi:uncharacterized protein LOC122062374 [Macadamia integrifolia]|uniref:uncharacterized protein LOC122062374 n=1 Tax=Macadamia integrifolia TaxID=60698 RepID=UPI001C4EDF0D|nr:uncharacterized protein LOC122062374 [Macadamia integrifolia]
MSDQQISLLLDWKGSSLELSVVHAKCLRAEHRFLWTDLVAGMSSNPRMIIGDFNAVLVDHERWGSGRFCLGATTEFRAMVDATSMIQAPSTGRKFTWPNNRRRGNVLAVLDRTFLNEAWMELFDNYSQHILQLFASDHAPLLVCSGMTTKSQNRPFRINKFWMEHPNFFDMVCNSWRPSVTGSDTFILGQKLKRLKIVMKLWSRETFPHLDHEVSISQSQLDQIQKRIEEEGHSEELFDLEADVKTRFLKASKYQEKLRQQKSRIRWLRDGDKCLRFFHVMAKVKRAKNYISSIVKEDGETISDQGLLGTILLSSMKTFIDAWT